jgi:hypothetical protein
MAMHIAPRREELEDMTTHRTLKTKPASKTEFLWMDVWRSMVRLFLKSPSRYYKPQAGQAGFMNAV